MSEGIDTFNAGDLGLTSLTPFPANDSSSRGGMFGSHIVQTVPLIKTERKYLQSTLDNELEDFTFSVSAPCDMIVIDVIERTYQTREIESCPIDAIVIYQSLEDEVYGILELKQYYTPSYDFYHEFKMVNSPSPGDILKKGDILIDEVNKVEGDYGLGIQVKTLFNSDHSGEEDGVMISEALVDRMGFIMGEEEKIPIKTSALEKGEDSWYVPLNTYGNQFEYKILPDVGEKIRQDGVIFAQRKITPYNQITATVKGKTSEVDHTYDECTYSRMNGLSIVSSVRVHKNTIRDHSNDPKFKQIEEYYDDEMEFYRKFMEVINRERDSRLRNNRPFSFTPELSAFIESFSVMVPIEEGGFLRRNRNSLRTLQTFKKKPIDEFYVIINTLTEIKPDNGFKLTDSHGGKGVICKIVPVDQMPYNEEGERVEMVVSYQSTMQRMNLGRFYDAYVSGMVERVCKEVRTKTNKKLGAKKLKDVSNQSLKHAFEHILGFLKMFNPEQHDFYGQLPIELKNKAVLEAINNDFYLHIKHGKLDVYRVLNELISDDKNMELYGLPEEVIYYKDEGGVRRKYHNTGVFVSLNTLLIFKLGDRWIATSTITPNSFGVAAKKSRTPKEPFPETPTRMLGETEKRLLTAHCSPDLIAELVDRSGSLLTQQELYKTQLEAINPAGIEIAIDRDSIPFGTTQALKLFRNLLQTYGKEMVYEKEVTK